VSGELQQQLILGGLLARNLGEVSTSTSGREAVLSSVAGRCWFSCSPGNLWALQVVDKRGSSDPLRLAFGSKIGDAGAVRASIS
jgi:hypothetical protein